MGPSGDVESQITFQTDFGMTDRVIGFQEYFLILDGAPQPLDKHVVAPAALASILMRMPLARSRPVNSLLVNCSLDPY